MATHAVTFQDIIEKLNSFWKKQGCLIVQPYDLEVGAGTFHPITFFSALGKKPARSAFVQASRRPTDGRYGDNPLRASRYYQYQVIIKPEPARIQELYIESLAAIGIDAARHDFRFVEDDWESPTLGAWGLGWEVWLDSLEVTQFTYFQQMGGINVEPITCEITYGLERLAMFIQKTTDLFNVAWSSTTTYGALHKAWEKQLCTYNFEVAGIDNLRTLFEVYTKESIGALAQQLLYPSYEALVKMSHVFNILDARGALSVAERSSCIAKIRHHAKQCAQFYIDHEEAS